MDSVSLQQNLDVGNMPSIDVGMQQDDELKVSIQDEDK